MFLSWFYRKDFEEEKKVLLYYGLNELRAKIACIFRPNTAWIQAYKLHEFRPETARIQV